jgi:hypothetical protein
MMYLTAYPFAMTLKKSTDSGRKLEQAGIKLVEHHDHDLEDFSKSRHGSRRPSLSVGPTNAFSETVMGVMQSGGMPLKIPPHAKEDHNLPQDTLVDIKSEIAGQSRLETQRVGSIEISLDDSIQSQSQRPVVASELELDQDYLDHDLLEEDNESVDTTITDAHLFAREAKTQFNSEIFFIIASWMFVVMAEGPSMQSTLHPYHYNVFSCLFELCSAFGGKSVYILDCLTLNFQIIVLS